MNPRPRHLVYLPPCAIQSLINCLTGGFREEHTGLAGSEVCESGTLPAEMFRAHWVRRAPRCTAEGAPE